MKSFVIAIILFLLLFVFIVFNNIHINSTVDRLIVKAEALPSPDSDNCIAMIKDLANDWKESEHYISFSTEIDKLDRVSDLFEALSVYAEYGDHTEYERARRQLVVALKGTSTFESLKFDDIF